MIALVLGSIIVGVVLQFVSGQTRTASAQTAREEVQQNARGALEIVGSDLRGAIAGGLIFADDQRLDFMLPRRWGVVCRASATETIAVFPVVPGDPLPIGAGVGITVERAGAWLPAATAPMATVVRADRTAAAANVCGAEVSPAGQTESFALIGTGHPVGAQAGDRLAVYQLVRYDVGQSGGESWIRRSNGAGIDEANMQPLAGPVDPDSVRFQYLGGNPPAPLDFAPGDARTSGVRMIRFRVRTTSRMAANGEQQVEQDSVTVQIRN